jgi:calcium permeable stress-gated cation channel
MISTNILFMGTVALVFAPLAPLVCLGAAVVFWMSSWVYKYQLMFVFTSKVESGGVSFGRLSLLRTRG